MPTITLEQAKAAKGHVLKEYGHLDEVVGVGITRRNDEYAVKVNLSSALRSGSELPRSHGGVTAPRRDRRYDKTALSSLAARFRVLQLRDYG